MAVGDRIRTSVPVESLEMANSWKARVLLCFTPFSSTQRELDTATAGLVEMPIEPKCLVLQSGIMEAVASVCRHSAWERRHG